MNILIIGGAGFIGSNAAKYFLKKGNNVTILDDFSRKGTRNNLEWIKEIHPNVQYIEADICKDQQILDEQMEKNDVVLHLAAQVAVTLSVQNPRKDFEINLLGTFNILEAIRKSSRNPILLYSSTNKVYGGLEQIQVEEKETRYEYKDIKGVDEEMQLDFHSPYGCSKGAADQYVIDYARIYGLKTVVFRQSCIYGTRQFGIEDQGWVSWFVIATTLEKPLKIFGNGKQVRDVLFVEDLIRCYELAIENIDKISGNAYNIGGGPQNCMSLLELIEYLKEFHQKEIDFTFHEPRPGDQPIFICNIDKAKRDFGWEPKIGVKEGVRALFDWVQENKSLF